MWQFTISSQKIILVIKIMPLGMLEMHLMIFDVVTCVTIVVAYAVVGVIKVLTTLVIG
jgi:hypothetical protein